MIPRGWALLLSAYLLLWIPLGFAQELFVSLPSVGRRGPLAVAELALHGIVAMAAGAAGWMVQARAPAAAAAAAAAVVAAALISLQSLFWSMLPRQVAPGARGPLAVIACAHALFWLAMIAYYARRNQSEPSG
jgi:hypothetical protein